MIGNQRVRASWASMIFSENRFPLFGMLERAPPAIDAGSAPFPRRGTKRLFIWEKCA
jgi:hypothetical protein